MLTSQDLPPSVSILLQSHKHRDDQYNNPLELQWQNGASCITKIMRKHHNLKWDLLCYQKLYDSFMEWFNVSWCKKKIVQLVRMACSSFNLSFHNILRDCACDTLLICHWVFLPLESSLMILERHPSSGKMFWDWNPPPPPLLIPLVEIVYFLL